MHYGFRRPSDPYSGKRVAELPEAIDEDLFDDQPEKQLMLQDCLQQLFPVVYRLWPYSANSVLAISGMLQSTD